MYGPAVVCFKDPDTAFNPSSHDNLGVNDAFPSPWSRFGFTEGPTSFKYNRTEKSVMSNEYLSPVVRFATMEEGTFALTAKEVNPGQMNTAIGVPFKTVSTSPGNGYAGSEQLVLGGEPALKVHMWCLSSTYINAVGVAFPVRLYIWRGTARLMNALAWEREETPNMEIEISALADVDRQQGQRMFAYRKLWAPITA